MTTLSEKAREYAQREFCQIGYCGGETPCLFNANLDYEEMCGIVHAAYDAYIAGVTEATRWRYVNVELPELKEKVLVKNNNGVVDIACLWDEKTKTFCISQYGTDGIFLHFDFWRPIETI